MFSQDTEGGKASSLGRHGAVGGWKIPEGKDRDRKGRTETGREGQRPEGKDRDRKGRTETGREGQRQEGKDRDRKGRTETGREGQIAALATG
eukprot:scaffold22846_cov67-Isochrysis_galbana.AAC.1